MQLCPKCANENDDRALYCQSCGTALKPPSAEALAPIEYGGFWIRAGAWVIDAIILSIGGGLLVTLTFGGGTFVLFFLPWIYEAWMQSSEWQATVGKRALNLVVTGTDGKRITFARATGRHFAKWISAILLGLGFIMAAFTEKKQGLHDLIAETLVVIRPR
jgi:uncharacterized RDD family membrane protein YckC